MSNEVAKTEAADLSLLLPGTSSPAMHIMLNDQLFERAKLLAKYMSNAEGFTPRHLIGKSEACFAVVTRSLTWKLDPFAVAGCTYQTPGGAIGYEGKLCQAILENSGKIEGNVKYHHYGDWSKVQGKFKKVKSDKGKLYPVPDWKEADEEGLGVTVSAKIIGEPEERTWDFDLVQAFPRNSTLWATDPKTQICYTAVRRFANVAAPGLFMGVPFDRDDVSFMGPEHAKDVTPRPARADFANTEGAHLDADGDPVPEGKTLREHYVDKAAARQAKKDEARMDQELAGATGGPMPPDQEDDEEEPAGDETPAPEDHETSPFADGVPLIDEVGEVVKTIKKPMPWFGDLQTMMGKAKDPQALIELNQAGALHWCEQDGRSANLWQQCKEDAEVRAREPALGV